MTRTRRRLAATIALGATTVLLPIAALTAVAPAAHADAPDCSVQEAAFQETTGPRDAARGDLAAFVAGEYAARRAAKQQAAGLRDQARQDKEQASAAFEAAYDAYVIDPTEENADALAEARSELTAAKAPLVGNRASYQAAVALFAEATATRKEKAQLRDSTKAASVQARAAVDACQGQPYAEAANVVVDGDGYVIGTVTFRNVADAPYYFSSTAQCGTPMYDCGPTGQPQGGQFTLSNVDLGSCVNPVPNRYDLIGVFTGATHYSLTVSIAAACEGWTPIDA